ncbi:recombinase family protein [Rhodobacteraceae bacterium RKSG542]|uniref:recombinase family protein n=1 Tax=Pseudovibrio flavus TaxID=2529854 RepID=UPI0012BB7BCB|nr:recombinase family protein [Pseudovibrio flavus]MTI17430.1 recombinase family protein [Pseudovibrio flavus]
MKFGYARVSSKEQNEARQIEALVGSGIPPSAILIDKCSGATMERPKLKELLIKLRDGDDVTVHSMDRLARSLPDLHSLVDEMTSKGVTIRFLKESQTFGPQSDPLASLMLGVLGAVAQFERAIIRQRQAEGISAAKARGVYTGRKPSIDREKVKELLLGGMNKTHVARELGVNRASVIRIAKELEEGKA